jgi:hypothetical protein
MKIWSVVSVWVKEDRRGIRDVKVFCDYFRANVGEVPKMEAIRNHSHLGDKGYSLSEIHPTDVTKLMVEWVEGTVLDVG